MYIIGRLFLLCVVFWFDFEPQLMRLIDPKSTCYMSMYDNDKTTSTAWCLSMGDDSYYSIPTAVLVLVFAVAISPSRSVLSLVAGR